MILNLGNEPMMVFLVGNLHPLQLVASNGKLIEGNASDTMPVVVTLSSDKSSYTILMILQYFKELFQKEFLLKNHTFQAEPILINISGPNYEHSSFTLYPDSNLNYETTLRISLKSWELAEGNYDVSVNYDGVVATSTSFSVEF